MQLHLDSSGELTSLDYLISEGVQCTGEPITASTIKFVGKATVSTPSRVASYVRARLARPAPPRPDD